MEFVYVLIIGIVAGCLAWVIMKGGVYGLLGDLLLGVTGAVVGDYMFGVFGNVENGLLWRNVTATVGAIVLLALVRLIRRFERRP